MAIVGSNPLLESRLDAAATSWRQLTDADYREVTGRWRREFWISLAIESGAAFRFRRFTRPLRDARIICNDFCASIASASVTARGESALASLESRLPDSVFLFNGISVSAAAVVSTRTSPIAYDAHELREIDPELFNRLDLIVVDRLFTYSCICTQEWRSLADPLFVEPRDSPFDSERSSRDG